MIVRIIDHNHRKMDFEAKRVFHEFVDQSFAVRFREGTVRDGHGLLFTPEESYLPTKKYENSTFVYIRMWDGEDYSSVCIGPHHKMFLMNDEGRTYDSIKIGGPELEE